MVDARGLHQVADGHRLVLAVFSTPVFDRLEGWYVVRQLPTTFDTHLAVGINGRHTQVKRILAYVDAHAIPQENGWGLLLLFHRCD